MAIVPKLRAGKTNLHEKAFQVSFMLGRELEVGM